MCNQAEQNRDRAEKLIHALFKGAGLSGFSFSTSFTLEFSRGPAEFEGNVLPPVFEREMPSDWWFGTKAEWQYRVSQFDTRDFIEPDEPVQAFELAHLRWMEGSEVDFINFEEDVMIIHFVNGKSLTISLCPEYDDEWSIKEWNVSSANIKRLITCEDGELYVIST
jgi:hypothetical protein